MASVPIVFVINLDRSPERLAGITERLRAANIRFRRITAIDGRTNDLAAELAKQNVQVEPMPDWDPLSPSEIACYLSHRRALQRIVREQLPAGCILEDDVAVAPHFGKLIAAVHGSAVPNALIKFQSTHGDAGPDTGKFLISGYIMQHAHGIRQKPAAGACGYYVTRQAAQRLLEIDVIRYPYDLLLMDTGYTRLEVTELVPNPVSQMRGIPSTIGSERNRDKPRLESRKYQYRPPAPEGV